MDLQKKPYPPISIAQFFQKYSFFFPEKEIAHYVHEPWWFSEARAMQILLTKIPLGVTVQGLKKESNNDICKAPA